MTITTEVRILWPVPAVALLDHVTRVAGGDPATVARTAEPGYIWNHAGQGLMTLAWVHWSEKPHTGYEPEDEDDDAWPEPPALVRLAIDNPYGRADGPSGRQVQAHTILPAVVEWLDAQGVPRDAWWWQDESAGTYHPGTVDVRLLDDDTTPREAWQP